jgi:hypothetical protein
MMSPTSTANTHRRREHLDFGLAACLVLAAGMAAVVLALTWSGSSSAQATGASSSDPGGASAPIDCVTVTHLAMNRGLGLANAFRFGESQSSLQTSYRVGELNDADLRAFCDWEACVSTNGYNHSCGVNDRGWEFCRVCDGGADCDGYPISPQDCVQHAREPARASCHAGLLQECLLQRSMRGPTDVRLTRTCYQSKLACAGELPGDGTDEAVAARHETDQVAVEVAVKELGIAAELQPDAGFAEAAAKLSTRWDGGLPVDLAEDGAVLREPAAPIGEGPPEGGSSDR